MKFYLVDDEHSILYVLQNIIEQNFDDEVVGMSSDPQQAVNEIQLRDVDIVLVDFLMPEMSGIELIQTIKNVKPQIRFIMISKVQDGDMRAKAYQAGIEFFISKPLNIIEIKSVIKKVEQNVQMAAQLSSISAMVNKFNTQPDPQSQSVTDQATTILKALGMSSERGTSDILHVVKLMKIHHLNYRSLDLVKILGISNHEKKIMEQRMRRAIKVGLVNLSNQLIDNPYDEGLSNHANNLFGYENVHAQMLHQQGKQLTGGRITLQKFMDGLIDEESFHD